MTLGQIIELARIAYTTQVAPPDPKERFSFLIDANEITCEVVPPEAMPPGDHPRSDRWRIFIGEVGDGALACGEGDDYDGALADLERMVMERARRASVALTAAMQPTDGGAR